MAVSVVQWGTGNVGRQALAEVIRRPGLDLVGVLVTDPGKVGRDAGELAGGASVGVRATNSRAEIIELAPEVVLHMPLPSAVYGDDPSADLDDFVALLEAGINVITTVGYMYPSVYGPEVMGRIEAACAAGRSRFHGTGANPGWFGDLVPLLMSGLSLRIDAVEIREISNFERYPSPEIMFDMMNFGATPERFEANGARHRRWLDGLFVEAVQMVAEGLGVTPDETSSHQEVWLAEDDLTTAAGTVPAGTVAGQRYRWEARVGGRAVVSQETVWRMHAQAAPHWPQGHWSIDIVGEPAMHLTLGHGWNRNVLGSTGAHAINAIPYLLDTEPGVRTFLDLPLVAGRGAVSMG